MYSLHTQNLAKCDPNEFFTFRIFSSRKYTVNHKHSFSTKELKQTKVESEISVLMISQC